MKRYYIILFFAFASLLLFGQTATHTVGFAQNIGNARNYNSISEAIASIPAGQSAEVWVAQGHYKEQEIIVPINVKLIGGFPKNAARLSDRIYPGKASTAQLSIIDGQYLHRAATVQGTIDGFQVIKGYAYRQSGGGLLIDGGTVINCIIAENIASNRPASPVVIPGKYVASIGDIFCTDSTIVSPTYKINQTTGKLVASIPNGALNGKTVQGIVFYVNTASVARSFHVMATVSPNTYIWSNPTFDVPTIPNYTTKQAAQADFNGKGQTDSLKAYIPRYTQAHGNPWWQTTNWAITYIDGYNTPTGTLGQWYLPTAGEMYKLWEVHEQMNACAIALGWTSEQNGMFKNDAYWTSSEADASNVWMLDAYSSPWSWSLSSRSKTQGGYVIPVTTITLPE